MKAIRGNRDLPEPGISECLDWAAPAHDVLVVGHAREGLLESLDARGCSVTCVVLDGTSADEARVFCSAVHAASGADIALEDILQGSTFDAVVFDGTFELVAKEWPLLAQARRLLRRDGTVIATFSSADRVSKAFARADYRIERFKRIGSDGAQGSQFILLAAPRANISNKDSPIERSEASLDPRGALEREREARDGLQTALQDAERAASEFERRIADIAARREKMQAELDERARQIDRLQTLLDESRARIRALEQGAARAESASRGLRNDLDAEQSARARLQKILDVKTQALVTARADAAQAEDAWFELYAELEQERARSEELERTLALSREETRKQKDLVQRMSAAESATNKWAIGLQRKIADLNAQISQSGDYVADLLKQVEAKQAQIDEGAAYARRLEAEHGDYVADLLKQVEAKQAQIDEGAAYARRLEAEVAERSRQTEELTCELEAVRKAAIADKLVMRDYVDSLHEQVAALRALTDGQQQLAAQVEDVISNLQAENAQLITLIDTVQSSHFWRLKRWLNRLRARVIRR